jgi:uncharacterized membrane protein YedE/YeeE
MMSKEMEALILKRHKTEKVKKKNQIPYAIIILVIASIISVSLWRNNHSYVVFWITGISFGIVLRYSRFCFAAAFRDPFLVKNTKLMRALLLSLMISTTGFAIIQYGYLKNNSMDYAHIPGMIISVGFHTMIGAFIFGIGMSIAGGCAASVLMRIGEGHVLPWVTLLGFFIGTVLGAKDYSFWYEKIIKNAKIVYFPKYVNLGIVFIVQMIVLIILYKLMIWYQKKSIKR